MKNLVYSRIARAEEGNANDKINSAKCKYDNSYWL